MIESTLARWQPAERHDVLLDPALQLRLQDFYRDDVLRLATLTGQTPPWPDFFPGGRSTTRGRGGPQRPLVVCPRPARAPKHPRHSVFPISS